MISSVPGFCNHSQFLPHMLHARPISYSVIKNVSYVDYLSRTESGIKNVNLGQAGRSFKPNIGTAIQVFEYKLCGDKHEVADTPDLVVIFLQPSL